MVRNRENLGGNFLSILKKKKKKKKSSKYILAFEGFLKHDLFLIISILHLCMLLVIHSSRGHWDVQLCQLSSILSKWGEKGLLHSITQLNIFILLIIEVS